MPPIDSTFDEVQEFENIIYQKTSGVGVSSKTYSTFNSPIVLCLQKLINQYKLINEIMDKQYQIISLARTPFNELSTEGLGFQSLLYFQDQIKYIKPQKGFC